jgi:hypothetical protein
MGLSRGRFFLTRRGISDEPLLVALQIVLFVRQNPFDRFAETVFPLTEASLPWHCQHSH